MANAPSLNDDCWTCAPVQEYVKLADDYTKDLSAALQEPMLILFSSCVGLWVVVTAYKVLTVATTPAEIVKDFFLICTASILLHQLGPAPIDLIYTASLKVMGGAADAALEVGGNSVSGKHSGMPALGEQGETAISTVFKIGSSIALSGSALNPVKYIYAAALVIPYFLLIVVFFAKVVVSIFRVMLIATFAPFLFFAFAFGWGRGMAVSGFKTLISTIMILFATTIALAVTIYGVNGLDLDSKSGIPLSELTSITNPHFLVVMALGYLGTAFMIEANSIANSITGTLLTNTAAGIITAGVTGSAMMALKAANPLNAGTRYLGLSENTSKNIEGYKTMGNHAQAVGQTLANKFKNFRSTSQ